MGFRFGEFELDDRRRELRLNGRELPVQPRVLDLLLYLVAHRDRVVSKEELLEALWPGRVVVDGALQRVVSLARSVLHQGGARDVIRTHARVGYRFCGEAAPLDEAADAGAPRDGHLEQVRRAYQDSRWEAAVAGYAQADRRAPLLAADLERWAQAAYWAGDARAAVEPLERAVAAHLSAGDRRGAARCALLLAQIAFERMEHAVAAGWQKRAARFLAGLEASREHGLMHYLEARTSVFLGDYPRALEAAEQARQLGVELEDPDLEGLGLVYAGHALLARGEVERGLDCQNEAAAAVLANQVGAWAGAMIYCAVLWTCRNRADWERAAQWTEQFNRWCERRGMAAFPGTCRLHRAEVLTVRGLLDEAAQELDQCTTQLSAWAPWAEGDAFRVLGDLRLGQGDLAGAESAFRRARELGWDPQPGHALLLLAQGRPEAAARALASSLAQEDWVSLERRGVLLAHQVVAAARAGWIGEARERLAELDERPALITAPALQALVSWARGELAWAQGQHDTAVVELRRAAGVWQGLAYPLNVAQVRRRLGEMLREAGDAAGAAVELELAAALFEQHGAPRLAEGCLALLAAEN